MTIDQGVKEVTVDFPIGGITYSATPPLGKITITGSDGNGGTGSTTEYPGGKDYTFTDPDGNIWTVDENGNISGPQKPAKGGASTPANTDGVDSSGSATAITAQGIKVEFENKKGISGASKYAFDKPTKALTSDYKEIEGKFIPFKAVENQKTEPFIAKVTLTDTAVKADSLIFKTSKGLEIVSKKIAGTDNFELTLKGTYSYGKEEVQAVIKQGDKYKVAGVFYLVHISPKTIKLNLVPTSASMNLEQKKQEIKDIYSKVAIDVDISVKPSFDISQYLVDGKLPTADAFGDLSTYSNAQNSIISKYKSENNVGLEYCIFVTDKPSSTGQDGYMRLNGQFGFVFNQSAKTIAHELGHGALKLEHPFKQFSSVTKGSTTGLLDYANGTDFIYTDWKQINDPAFKLYAFQGQSSGEMYDRLYKDANGKYFDSGKNISVAVCLNKDEVQQANILPNGSVYAFHLVDSGRMYYAQKENDRYIYKTKSGETIDLTYVNIVSTNQKNAYTIYYPSAYKVTAKDYFGKDADIIGACSSGKFSSQQEEDEAYAFWQFLKNCYDSYKLQKEGYVPRCLWDHNLYIPNGPFGYYINDPAFSSGIVDGLIETADGVLDIVKFLDCYNPISFRAWTDECVDTRDKTYNALKQMYLVISNKDKLNEAYDAVKGKLGEYADETTAVDNQARYNHGKIVFNVASLFIGVGEAKALLNGEKTLVLVLKEGLSAYATIPETILKLTQKAGREGIAYIALKTGNKGAYLGYKLANTEIKLADVTAQQVFANIEWATKNGVILEKIENVKYIDQAGKEQSGVLELVKQEDGKLGVKIGNGVNFNLDKLLKNENFKKIYNEFKNGITPRKFANQLSLEEESVYKFYTNTHYYEFNQALIVGSKADDVIEIEKLLNNTLDKVESYPGTYYRGIGKNEIDILDKLKIGDEINYKNFLSTTKNEEVAIDFANKNKIKTGEGAVIIVESNNAKNIKKYSSAEFEEEILHKSNSKFILRKVESNKVLNPLQVAADGHPPIYGNKYYIIEK
jgi:hypothetical protein